MLQQVTPDLEGTKTIAAQKNENKNRLPKYLPRRIKMILLVCIMMFAHILPTADNHRVVLKQEESDYIHATFVNVSEYSQCMSLLHYMS